MTTKIKPPIMLSSLIQYYMQQPSLRRNKRQMIAQMKDLITITQFLTARIPSSMKAIKQTVRLQERNIKDLNQNLKNNLKALTQDSNLNTTYNLETAYDQLSHFPFNKESDKDYVEKTVAQKQMKLKFLQSENLPQDFIWHKPTRSIRDWGGQGRALKDYTWYSHFNSKLNMIEIVTRKYSIRVCMNVINKQYVWAIKEIKSKLDQDKNLWQVQYFQLKIIPAIKERYKERTQQNMLTCIDKFSYFLELLELQQWIAQLSGSERFAEKMEYKFNGRVYQFQFGKPEDLTDSIINIIQQQNPNFVFTLFFLKKCIRGVFRVVDLINFTTQNEFVFENPNNILIQFENLIEYGKKFLNFWSRKPHNLILQYKYFFINLHGILWICSNTQQDSLKNSYHCTKEDGIFIGKQYKRILSYLTLCNDGSLYSRNISRSFLNDLLQHVPKLDSLLGFVHLIESLQRGNSLKQSQLDHYKINDERRTVFLNFRKKVCIEEQMFRSVSRISGVDDDNQANALKFFAQINFPFSDINIFTARQKQNKIISEKEEEWTLKMKRNQPGEGLLDIERIISLIKYLQDHHIIKYAYDKKIKPAFGGKPGILLKL